MSIYPPLTYAGIYGNGNGGGDFTTWVQGNNDNAFVAFPFAPRGEVLDTYLARVPIRLLRRAATGDHSVTVTDGQLDLIGRLAEDRHVLSDHHLALYTAHLDPHVDAQRHSIAAAHRYGNGSQAEL